MNAFMGEASALSGRGFRGSCGFLNSLPHRQPFSIRCRKNFTYRIMKANILQVSHRKTIGTNISENIFLAYQ